MPFAATRRNILIAILCGVGLLVLAFLVWWNFIYQSPRRVFEGMLENNLQVSSVTKHEYLSDTSQTVDKYIRLQLGSVNASQNVQTTSLKQQATAVTTESVGTPTQEYVRYVKLTSNQKQANGRPIDFRNVLNVWGKVDATNQATPPVQFSQSLLDVGTVPAPPIGNVTPEQKENITQFIRDQSVFMPDYATMQRTTFEGRRAYVYDVSVKLAPYVRMMQAFASDIGLHELDSLDPTSYQSAPPIKITLTVDTASHHLRQIAYKQSGFTETYSDYGLSAPITIPTKTIPASELQARLQKL